MDEWKWVVGRRRKYAYELDPAVNVVDHIISEVERKTWPSMMKIMTYEYILTVDWHSLKLRDHALNESYLINQTKRFWRINLAICESLGAFKRQYNHQEAD